MASGPLLGGGDGSREKQRWPENKVYTRKLHRQKPPPQPAPNPPPPPDSSNKTPPPAASTTPADAALSSHQLPRHSPDPPQPPARIDSAAAAPSDDASSSLNHCPPPDLPPENNNSSHQDTTATATDARGNSNSNDHQATSGGDRTTITISLASRSQDEVRDIRQRLTGELEQVRAFLKKIEDHEQVSVPPDTVPVVEYTVNQFSDSNDAFMTPVPPKRALEDSGMVHITPTAAPPRRSFEAFVPDNNGDATIATPAPPLRPDVYLSDAIGDSVLPHRPNVYVPDSIGDSVPPRHLNAYMPDSIGDSLPARRLNAYLPDSMDDSVPPRQPNIYVRNSISGSVPPRCSNTYTPDSMGDSAPSRRLHNVYMPDNIGDSVPPRRLHNIYVPDRIGESTPTLAPPRRPLSVYVPDNEVIEKEKRTPKANQYYRNSDFLLAKDKFPPADKKSKTNGSKKHDIHAMDRKLYGPAFRSCRSLLARLMKHKFGWVFNTPVDVKGLGLHDYYTIIKHPMDLGTVKNRLSKNWYKTPDEFAEDVRLTFHNAMTYNPKPQDVHIMAEQLLQIFEERWPAIEAEFAHIMYMPPPRKPLPIDTRTLERSDSTVHPMTVDSVPKPVNYVPHVSRPPALKKPKAKDLNKRDMTFEEKQKLSNNLQNLPPEKLDNIVQIIKKRNTSLSQHDDEIEVDIDSVDVETLWELDRFVTNYKKSLSKNKRRAELAMLRAQGVINMQGRVQERAPGSVVVEVPQANRTVADDKNVASSVPVRGGNNENNASGSSSSCSSSSDSGSSSSDSDSDSSSGYGSGRSPIT